MDSVAVEVRASTHRVALAIAVGHHLVLEVAVDEGVLDREVVDESLDVVGVDAVLVVVPLLGDLDRRDVDLGLHSARAHLGALEVRDGDGRQDADDGNDDHELDQGEAFTVVPHDWSP